MERRFEDFITKKELAQLFPRFSPTKIGQIYHNIREKDLAMFKANNNVIIDKKYVTLHSARQVLKGYGITI